MQASEAMTAAQSMKTSPGPTAAELRLQRNLKIVVIGLAVLMLAGLARHRRARHLSRVGLADATCAGCAGHQAGAEAWPAGGGAGAGRVAVGK